MSGTVLTVLGICQAPARMDTADIVIVVLATFGVWVWPLVGLGMGAHALIRRLLARRA